MLTLYHHGSSVCAAKVRIVLQEKALPWEGVYLDILAGEQFSPDYLRINAKGLVPVLLDGDEIVTESTVICEYLDDKFTVNPVRPADPAGKARCRIWTKLVDEELHPACKVVTFVISHRHVVMRSGLEKYLAGHTDLEYRDRKRRWAEEGLNCPEARSAMSVYVNSLEKMEETLDRMPWLAGDRYSLADAALTPYVNRLDMLGMSDIWVNKLPAVTKWFGRVRERSSFYDAVDRWLPEELRENLNTYGKRSWPDIKRLLDERAV